MTHGSGVPAANGSSPTRTRVIYIAGTGRSGSTLLGNTLGSLPASLSAGEVKLALRRGVGEKGHCGCRELVTECPVWRPALEATFGSVPTPAEALDLDHRLGELVRTRRVPWWVGGRASGEADEMIEIMGRLTTALATASGATTIVDSSKLPSFGALLARSPLLDVKVVHLVRDPRAVAFSWQRESASQVVGGFEEDMERFSAAKSALMWVESSTSVPALWRGTSGSRITVRYEDFVASPSTEVRRVAEFAGVEPDLSFVREDGLHLKTSHAAAGNPNRVRSGPITLRRDDEWRDRLTARDRSVVSALTAPRRRAYGY